VIAERIGPRELEQYLHLVMPLSRAMQVAVRSISSDGVVLSAPLAPNVNHRGTVFGGSACALGTLAAWSLLYCRLQGRSPATSLVLQRNTMVYERPMAGDFSAHASLPPGADWMVFLRTLERRGKARISVSARLLSGEQDCGHYLGEFVALPEAEAARAAPAGSQLTHAGPAVAAEAKTWS